MKINLQGIQVIFVQFLIKILIGAVLICSALFIFILIDRMTDPHAGRVQSCEKMRPGITLVDLERHLGPSYGTPTHDNNLDWYKFEPDRGASTYMYAGLSQDKKIVALSCQETVINWSLDPTVKYVH